MSRLVIASLIAIVILLLALSPIAASAQSPISGINWWTIDAGGGEVASGDYQLRGTVGQPDAGRVAANWYELQGGYWAGAVVRHPRTYLPLILGYLEIEQRVTYGQVTIVALVLVLAFVWRVRRLAA